MSVPECGSTSALVSLSILIGSRVLATTSRAFGPESERQSVLGGPLPASTIRNPGAPGLLRKDIRGASPRTTAQAPRMDPIPTGPNVAAGRLAFWAYHWWLLRPRRRRRGAAGRLAGPFFSERREDLPTLRHCPYEPDIRAPVAARFAAQSRPVRFRDRHGREGGRIYLHGAAARPAVDESD